MLNSGASYFSGHGLSRSASVSSPVAPPFLLGAHGSPWAPLPSERVSPMRMGRQNYSTTPPFHVARAHHFREQAGDRTAGQPLGQPLSIPCEQANPRGASQSPLESLTDPANQSSRHGPSPNLPCSTIPASASSVSSTLSSSVATPSSNYAMLGSLDDVKSQRSLPPLSTVGIEPLANTAFPDSGGPANLTPLTYRSNSQTLPFPLHSPFQSSSPSGKLHTVRNSGEGAW